MIFTLTIYSSHVYHKKSKNLCKKMSVSEEARLIFLLSPKSYRYFTMAVNLKIVKIALPLF